MSNKKWQATLADVGAGWDAAGGGTVSSHKDRARVILKGANYATMLAYLWRRFGPPPTGWDPHKELVNYWITTPVKGIAFGLACSPCFESCGAGVFYAIDKNWQAKVRNWEVGAQRAWVHGLASANLFEPHIAWAVCDVARGNTKFLACQPSPAEAALCRRVYREHCERVGPRPWREYFDEWPGMEWGYDRPPVPIGQLEDAPQKQILAAIEAGLRDLLRPVNIRDVYINACGRVPDAEVKRAVKPFADAGYGCKTRKDESK